MDQESEPAERALALEPRHEIVGEGDPLERLTEHELAGMQDEWAVLRHLHRLRQILHRLAHIDERMPRVVEDAEAPVDAQVDARRLDHRGVERVDQDPPAFDLRADGAVAEYHAAAIVVL